MRMPRWSKGHVALVGDGCVCPVFSVRTRLELALVSACVLAGELATRARPEDAFVAYERLTRPFVEANQALATDGSGALFLPKTQKDIQKRDHILAEIARNGTSGIFDDTNARVHNALPLPDCASVWQEYKY